jgi:hypothetical protein
MNTRNWTIFATLALLIGAGSAHLYRQHTPVVIGFNPGGGVGEFLENYDEIRRSGRKVVIDGICISACTLAVGTLPRDRVCVTPFAKLAFHSAWRGSFVGPTHSQEGTRLVWSVYPEDVREILRKRGWDGDPPGLAKKTDDPPKAQKGATPKKAPTNEHPELIYIEGDELRSIFAPCE